MSPRETIIGRYRSAKTDLTLKRKNLPFSAFLMDGKAGLPEQATVDGVQTGHHRP